MNRTVVLLVKNGIVDIDTLPDDVTVVVRDYDCDGIEEELVAVDEYGDKYVEFIHEVQQYIATVQAYLKGDSDKQTMMLFIPVAAIDPEEAERKVWGHFNDESHYIMNKIISIVEKS